LASDFPFWFDFVCRMERGGQRFLLIIAPTKNKTLARCQEKPARKQTISDMTRGVLLQTTTGVMGF